MNMGTAELGQKELIEARRPLIAQAKALWKDCQPGSIERAVLDELAWQEMCADMSDGCLHMVGECLRGLGCGCGPNSHKDVPAMFYPELIHCVMRKVVMDTRAGIDRLAPKPAVPTTASPPPP